MAQPLPAYRGRDSYVFVSYAHADENAVFAEIRWLQDQGIKVWYDTTGIGPGSEWNHEIATAIKGADRFLYFITAQSVASENCRRELSFAQANEKAVLAVHLEKTELPDGLQLSLDNRQAVRKDRLSPGEYRDALVQALSISEADVTATPPLSEAGHRKPFYRELSPTPGKARWRTYGVVTLMIAVLAVGLWWYQQRAPARLSGDATVTVADTPLTAIAVMPFDDLSPNSDQDWLVNGMAEELIESLSRIEGLLVPSRNSTSILKEQEASPPAISEQLGVGSILQGSVQRSGNEIIVRAQWSQISDGRRLWSGRYERTLSDVFAVQAEITTGIAEAIRTELGIRAPASYLRKARYRTSDVRAWELLQRAFLLTRSFQPAKVAEARELLQRALEFDPDYVQAHAMLAFIDFTSGGGVNHPEVAKRLLRMDATNPTAHQILIWSSMAEWDFETAERLLDRAIEANPNANTLIFNAISLYTDSRQLQAALKAAKRGVRLDPLWASHHTLLGATYLYLGEVAKAIEHLEHGAALALESDQNLGVDLFDLALAYHLAGRDADAISSLLKLVPESQVVPTRSLEAEGWQAANLFVAEAIAARGDPCGGLRSLAQAGAEDRAYACIEELITADLYNFWMHVRVHPAFAPMREERRFQDLIGKLDERIALSAGTYGHASEL